MIERIAARRPARISFTADFHELVRGDLARSSSVLLRYDPLRIVPSGDAYVFGDPDRPVMVHARFGGAATVTLPLASRVGILPERPNDKTGNGNMLVGTLAVPDDARDIELWFSFTDEAGTERYDSDYGRNYRFGFAREQIALLASDVIDESGRGRFVTRVRTVASATRVEVRAHSVPYGSFPARTLALSPEEQVQDPRDGSRLWHGDFTVPPAAKVRFKLYYWIDGVRYKDDNDGLYYLAPPPPIEHVPPPPPELAAAARSWR